MGTFEKVVTGVAEGSKLIPLHQPHRWILWPASYAAVVLSSGLLVKELPQFTADEYRVDQFLSRHRTWLLDWVASGLNDLFGTSLGPWLAAVIGLILLIRGRAVNSVVLGLSLAAGCGSCWLMKLLVARHSATSEPSWVSYPSGHVAFAASLAIAFYWIFDRTRWRALVLLGGALMVLVVAWSRLYLGVHYPTDVLASCVLTPGSAGFAAGVWNKNVPRLLRFAQRAKPEI